MTLTISSPAFQDGGEIPARFTCEGADVSPPLMFGGVPAEAQSLVLIVDDPDAPDPAAPKRTYVHWVLVDIPPDVPGLAEGLTDLPHGTKEGMNDWKRTGYGGPCPPIGRHRYFFKLYALDTTLELTSATKTAVLSAMEGHVLAEAQVIGTYQKLG
jgi:Raf kinase inhibitor-like YbhB/YbcL family protein